MKYLRKENRIILLEMHVLKIFGGFPVQERQNNPKIRLKGVQKHKIDNIEESNAVGEFKLFQCVV